MNYQEAQERRARHVAVYHRRYEQEAARTHAHLFETSVDVDGHGCWNWLGKVSKGGYGYLMYRGRVIPSHRLAYLALVGPIPEGLVIDHLCENKSCVNPAHLEPVTIAENIRRHHAARNARIAAFA